MQIGSFFVDKDFDSLVYLLSLFYLYINKLFLYLIKDLLSFPLGSKNY